MARARCDSHGNMCLTKSDGVQLATVFAMQGVGRVLCSMVLILLLTVYPPALNNTVESIRWCSCLLGRCSRIKTTCPGAWRSALERCVFYQRASLCVDLSSVCLQVPGILALYWRITMEETVPFATSSKTERAVSRTPCAPLSQP